MRLFRAFQRPAKAPASTDGRVIYAIGDIHGRLDLLEPLLEQIRADGVASKVFGGSSSGLADRPVLVFVGDYVDRGADSKGVIAQVIALTAGGEFEVRALKGNHEGALLAFLDDPKFGPTWCEQGGSETMASYGIPAPVLRTDTEGWIKACEAFAEAIPPDHLRFLAQLELTAVYGDYVFVHAGLRPGIPLGQQREADLLWIRQEFLSAERAFEKIVVHGHTPAEEAYLGPHRVGIDTGAYATGVLTAVRLEDADRRLIQARSQHLR